MTTNRTIIRFSGSRIKHCIRKDLQSSSIRLYGSTIGTSLSSSIRYKAVIGAKFQ